MRVSAFFTDGANAPAVSVLGESKALYGGRMQRGIVALLVVMCAALLVSVTALPASADDSWNPDNPAYGYWNPDQYDPPYNDGSVYPLSISTTENDEISTEIFSISNIRPAMAFEQYATLTNNTSYPVIVHYVGGDDDGSIATYLFEWIEGWNGDITLQPGQTTPQFTLGVGMPCDTPNQATGTSGRFWWTWTVQRVDVPTQPVAVDDVAETAYETPVTIDVLANDTDVVGVTGITVTGDDPSQGTWSVVDNKVVFTPADGFSGVATASYTVTDQSGAQTTAKITVTVAGPDVVTPSEPSPVAPAPEPAGSDAPTVGPHVGTGGSI